jgi:hypothetical protein
MPDKYLSPNGRSCEPVRWVARSQRSGGRLLIPVSTGCRACSIASGTGSRQRSPAMGHGNADIGELTPGQGLRAGRFGRLFPTLPPFAADTPLIRGALAELGAPGGPMDAADDLSDPISLITDPAKSLHNPNNPTMTAGFTFLGQFLDHDMAFDPTSSLARRQDPESIRNFRIPALTWTASTVADPAPRRTCTTRASTAGGPGCSPRRSPGRRRCQSTALHGAMSRATARTWPCGRSAQRREPHRQPTPGGLSAVPQRRTGGCGCGAGKRLHR